MLQPRSLPKIYQRTVSDHEDDSLSIIASLIKPGQTVLDLGMGAGGLGHYLNQRHAVVADGVTLNQAEADIAAAWYRQIAVVNLDQADLQTIFSGQQYDCIVCADVLEHLINPENLLAQCKKLLKPGGQLLISIPNVGYCGLIAELIQGDFRYRSEGLLDSTHLRFFTRLSMQRFFAQHGWDLLSTRVTELQLTESEFKVAFDTLPPAVARHLLAIPDALSYQFVSVLQPALCADADVQISKPDATNVAPVPTSPAAALFSTCLYLATNGTFSEADKRIAMGQIGVARQMLDFEIPVNPARYSAIRLDPADRPGFLKLHHIKLRSPEGHVIWQWVASQNDLAQLSEMPHQQMIFQHPWELSESSLLLLCGEDPWMTLPLTTDMLDKVSEVGGHLELCVGWPMSADYLSASISINEMKAGFEKRIFQQVAELKQLESTNHAIQQRLLESEKKSASMLIRLQEIEEKKLTLNQQLLSTKNQVRIEQMRQQQLLDHLQTIERSTLFRVTRPIVKLKMKFDQALNRSEGNRKRTETVPGDSVKLTDAPSCVDIIVPVYRGLEETRCCVESVIKAKGHKAFRLILINDCSPEPELTSWLRTIAATDKRIELLENTENLGFVATVNRGMALSDVNDVLLLNSDTEVANDWLDRLERAAYSLPKVATVTPFSNNATICSYPKFCHSNSMPHGLTLDQLDTLFSTYLTGQVLPIPTGVGFCLYIRRACLKQVGLFDEVNFGKGYGEENDFCMRAEHVGWVNLHALDIFVRHAGGVSFGETKSTREQQAMETLNRLHPQYAGAVHAFIKDDPARNARTLIDLARVTGSEKPVVLNIIHNRDGGTLRHTREMAQHLADSITYLRLTPSSGGVVLGFEGTNDALEMHFDIPSQYDRLVHTLSTLQVGHIHYHHVLGHSPCIEELPIQLGVTHDFTAHDYYSYCPQISLTDYSDSYCGEQGLQQCRQCLSRNPAPDGSSIEDWRNKQEKLLSTARYLITPSRDAASRMERFVPNASIRVVPHEKLLSSIPTYPQPSPSQLSDTQPLKIAVLGALSKIKGADLLEAVATLAASERLPVEFHLIGYAYRNLRTQPNAKLTVHGRYDDHDLDKILQWLQPNLVWFPALWPETYSYTLSACLECGLPVVAPNLGAFAERLQGRSWSWVVDWKKDPAEWLTFFESIRKQNFCASISPEPVEAVNFNSSGIESMFDYRQTYLASLPRPSKVAPEQLRRLQQEMEHHPSRRKPTSQRLKASTLQLVIFLRSSALMSPMAKWVPTHLQRRLKSWLKQ